MEGQYRVPPPPPSYEGQGGLAEDKKIEIPDHADSPMPGQQTRENSSGSFNHSIPPPSYNPPPAADSRGPYTPGGQFDPMSPSSAVSNPPPFMAVCPPGPVPTTSPGSLPPPTMAVCPPGPNGTPPPVVPQLSEKEKKKGVPDWMKYGGAALAGATAAGL
ncbi:hypothetical protein ABG067_008585, partial [Albugo candida]